MDDDGLPIVGSGIDLTKVPAIQQRKIVAFLNQFIVHTVRFLNRFSTVCEEVFTCQHIIPLCNTTYTLTENVNDLMDLFLIFLQKLATVSLRIQQIETTLSILEAKLASIPGLEEVTVDGVRQTSAETNGPAVDGSRATVPPVEASQQTQVAPQEPKAEAPAENIMTVAKDPRYARYLKMVQVGVPVMAIKNKMVMEGLDPSLLDTPDAPVPDGAKKGLEDQDDDSSGSESSFSD